MPFAFEHDLSEEILDYIVSSCSQGSKAALCRCSKKTNRIATPHLYHAVHFQASTGGACLLWLLPFAHLIFTSPTHASFVRSFTSEDGWSDDMAPKERDEGVELGEEDKRPWPGSGTAELEEALKKTCATHTTDEGKATSLYDRLRGGENEGDIVALLLASFPNLRELDLRYGSYTSGMIEVLEGAVKCAKSRGNFRSDLMEYTGNSKPASLSPTPFSQPLDMLVSGTEDKYPNDPRYLAVFLNLPNLRSLYGWMFGDEGTLADQRYDSFTRLKPRSCPVEYIECRTCKFHPDNLKSMMNATIPGKLKTFLYEIGCAWAWVDVQNAEIMMSLEPHYETLECLGLSHEEFYPYQFTNDNEEADPVSLRCFKSLKRLKIAPVFIFGHDGFTESELRKDSTKEMLWKALPHTLEELWISRAQGQEEEKDATVKFVPDCFIPALNLLVVNRESFPLLTQFRIDLPIKDWEVDWLDQLASFCHFAENNGIRCKIITTGALGGKYAVHRYSQRKWGWDEDVEWAPCENNLTKFALWIDVAEQHDLGDTLRSLWNEGHLEDARDDSEQDGEEDNQESYADEDEENLGEERKDEDK